MDDAPRGIRINAVCPGVIATPMKDDLTQNHPDRIAEIMRDQPIGRLGRAAEVAAAVLWLASPAASFIQASSSPSTVASPRTEPRRTAATERL